MDDKVSVVGLGKLGLGLALCIADAGVRTLGVDVDEDVVRAIGRGESPIVEPEYGELLQKLGGAFRATTSHAEAIDETDITFILVATPSIGDGRFSNRYVEAALRSLAAAFGRSGKKHHLFVVSSTVVPGSIDESFIPILEEHSGRKYLKDFDVCFDPDFVALGTVVRDFKRPDLVVIGESSTEAGNRVAAIHQRICENDPPIHRMSLVSAEVAKVSLNAYITMKISFANTVANLCERIPGTDVDQITSAIGDDRRISPHYLRGGLAFGGTCFPRDTKAFMTISRHHGVNPVLMSAVDEVNDLQNRLLSEHVLSGLTEDRRVSVLGLAFKDKTPVIEASPAVNLIKDLVENDVLVTVYDPLAMESIRAVFDEEISYAASVEDCIAASPLCVAALRSGLYKEAIEQYQPMEQITVIDCWRQIDAEKTSANIKIVSLGRYIEDAVSSTAKGTLRWATR